MILSSQREVFLLEWTYQKRKGEIMAYRFNIARRNAILNFSEEFCQSRCQLIESESFAKVLEKYIKDIKRRDTTIYEYLHGIQSDDVDLLDNLRGIFKLLLVMTSEEICTIRPEVTPYFQDKEMFIALVEDIYLFWRRLQRYAVVFNETTRIWSSKCTIC